MEYYLVETYTKQVKIIYKIGIFNENFIYLFILTVSK